MCTPEAKNPKCTRIGWQIKSAQNGGKVFHFSVRKIEIRSFRSAGKFVPVLVIMSIIKKLPENWLTHLGVLNVVDADVA